MTLPGNEQNEAPTPTSRHTHRQPGPHGRLPGGARLPSVELWRRRPRALAVEVEHVTDAQVRAALTEGAYLATPTDDDPPRAALKYHQARVRWLTAHPDALVDARYSRRRNRGGSRDWPRSWLLKTAGLLGAAMRTQRETPPCERTARGTDREGGVGVEMTNSRSPYWQHRKPLRCPKGHVMTWPGSVLICGQGAVTRFTCKPRRTYE